MPHKARTERKGVVLTRLRATIRQEIDKGNIIEPGALKSSRKLRICSLWNKRKHL